MRNPLSFTARTFNTIYFDLLQQYPDKPDWLRVMLAGMFDIAHWYLDARANNGFLDSAFTQEAIDRHCAGLDYYRSSASPASGTITVALKAGTTLPRTLSKEDLRFTAVRADGTILTLEAAAAETFSSLTKDIVFYEGVSRVADPLGQSDGVTAWQKFPLLSTNYIEGSGSITINGDDWTIKNTLVDSLPSDRHVRLIRLNSGYRALQFGDGVYGSIPPADYNILFSARYGGGVRGNFLTAGAQLIYLGSDIQMDTPACVFVSSQFTGGADEEDVENARELAPQLLRVNERAVTEDDYRLLSLRFSTSVARVKVLPGYYGSGTTGIHLIPAGGGLPSAGLKSSLETYLISVSCIGNEDVRVRDPLYTTQNFVVALKMKTGGVFATAQNYADAFLRLLGDETGWEVIQKWQRSDIAQTVTLINSLYSKAFTSSDYATIEKILAIVEENLVDWGGELRQGDVYQILESIPKVAYSTVTTPAGLVIYDFDKTPTIGTVTITQIP